MIFLRPVSERDHAEILALAQEAGIGMTSLPPDAQVLLGKIRRSVKSVEKRLAHAKGEAFLFVLEDSDSKKLVGTCGVVGHVGLRQPFYSYKLSTLVQASEELGIYSQNRVLHMVNDYTGASEIGSLFLKSTHRRDGIGKFLSRSRYLFMAEFPEFFSEMVIAEIRGVQDDQGQSPFYKNLAQHFFQMDFKNADFINATQGGQFISDLMPKYPIYVNLLDPKAQEVIGQPYHASRAAMQLLEAEGFRHQGYIDVFDGGPTLQAERTQIRTIRKSRVAKVKGTEKMGDALRFMLCNQSLAGFRGTLAQLIEKDDGVIVSADTLAALNLKIGDSVRYIEA